MLKDTVYKKEQGTQTISMIPSMKVAIGIIVSSFVPKFNSSKSRNVN